MTEANITYIAKYVHVTRPDPQSDLVMSFKIPSVPPRTVNVILSTPLALMLDAFLGQALNLPGHEFSTDIGGEEWLPKPDEE